MSEETQQAELKWFEELQNKLAAVFENDGYKLTEAQELSFCVAQGVRNVPPLLKMVDRFEQYTTDEVMQAVWGVLTNIYALQQANDLLLERNHLAVSMDETKERFNVSLD